MYTVISNQKVGHTSTQSEFTSKKDAIQFARAEIRNGKNSSVEVTRGHANGHKVYSAYNNAGKIKAFVF